MKLFMHIECYFEYKTGVPESWHKVQHKIPNSFLCAQFSFTLQQYLPFTLQQNFFDI